MFTCGPSFFNGASGAVDPLFSNTVLLCHFDGENGQLTTVDSSARAHALTGAGSVPLSSAQKKFGSTSAHLAAGSGVARFTAPDNDDWHFGLDPFTVEAWVYFTIAPGSNARAIIAQFGGSSNLGWYFGMNSGALRFTYSTTGTDALIIGAAWVPPLETWHHVAASKDSTNTLRVSVNGGVIASGVVSASLFNSTQVLAIGNDNNVTRRFEGFIDEVRITKGVARYDGAFTPPTAAFPNS